VNLNVVGTCNFAAAGHTVDDGGGESLEIVLLARPHLFACMAAYHEFVQHILHPE